MGKLLKFYKKIDKACDAGVVSRAIEIEKNRRSKQKLGSGVSIDKKDLLELTKDEVESLDKKLLADLGRHYIFEVIAIKKGVRDNLLMANNEIRKEREKERKEKEVKKAKKKG
jgi:hypothetical protein